MLSHPEASSGDQRPKPTTSGMAARSPRSPIASSPNSEDEVLNQRTPPQTTPTRPQTPPGKKKARSCPTQALQIAAAEAIARLDKLHRARKIGELTKNKIIEIFFSFQVAATKAVKMTKEDETKVPPRTTTSSGTQTDENNEEETARITKEDLEKATTKIIKAVRKIRKERKSNWTITEEAASTKKKPATYADKLKEKMQGIERTLNKDKLTEDLYQQNLKDKYSKEEFLKQFRLLFQVGNKEAPRTSWVAEVTPGMRQSVLQQERLYHNWTSYRIEDYCGVTRCYRCHRFGHVAKNCRSAETCGHCAAEGHSIKDCPRKAEPQQCANCKWANRQHTRAVTDKSCGAYQAKSAAAFDDLRARWRRYDFDFVVMQEPPVTPTSRVMNLEGMIAVMPRNVGKRKLSCVYVREDIDAVAEVTDQEWLTAIHVSVGRLRFMVVNVYLSPSQPVEEKLAEVTDLLGRRSNVGILLCGDVNGQSPLWYGRQNNPRGRLIENFLQVNSLEVVNRYDAKLTTYAGDNGTTANIDVTAASPHLAEIVGGWHLEDWSISDHRAVIFEVDAGRRGGRPASLPGKLCVERVPKIVEAAMTDARNSIEAEPSADGKAACLNRMLQAATEKATVQRQRRKPSASWWTDELTEARRAVRLSRNRYCEEKTNDNLTRFRQLRNKYVGLLRKTKADNWRTTATDAATKNTWGIVYQLARDKLHYKTLASAVEGVDGERICEDSAKAVLQKFLPEDDPAEDTTEQKEIRRCTEEPADELREDQETFDLDEVKRAVWRMAPRKAPGRDGVTATVLRAAWASIGATMTNIYNFSYRHGVFPTCWKQGEMRLIPKKDGGSRPLTLLPVAGKVYEHLLRDRIDKHLEEKSPINQRQYGFRAGRSTTDAIMEMVKYVRTSPDTYVCTLFLDIQGAFDNAWWPLVLHRLRRSGCPRNLYEVVRDYFRCRTTHITGNEFIVSRKASRGCPQGSILGPTFWNIVMDTFLEVSFRFPHLSIAYADDGLILFSGNSRNELARRADEIGDALTKWSRSCKLRICNKKTHTMMLKGKFKAGRQPLQLYIDGERIRMASSTVYLGVTIDEGLSFQRHLRETATAARDALRCIRRYSGTAWGFSYRDQWRIYKAVFEGIITYAAPVWAPLLAADRYLKIVNRSQRNALLLITKAFRTVSTEALQVVAGAMPMDILLRQREALYHHRRGEGNPTDTEKSIRERFTAEWQQRWTSTPKGRHTFLLWPNAYTGHGRFNAKLHEHGIVGDSTCAICGCEEDTVEHALWECPPTTRHRQLLENEVDNDTYIAALRNPKKSQQIQQYIQAVLQSRERTGRYSRRAELTRRWMRWSSILWRNSPAEELQEFQLHTVTYGTACAPFLAIRTLLQLAPEGAHHFPKASASLSQQTYVDDILTGADTLEEVLELKRQLETLLMAGGFELAKWATSSGELAPNRSLEPFRSGSLPGVGIIGSDMSKIRYDQSDLRQPRKEAPT
ncbi:UNVERIFIED_CONTAM: hypothetical protein PYX00_000003 [Menopon gallinae]|uniref:Reverse transcriptase n=1 Tax=Menopon gallinae TaxID=328185 RepID=A0AAW2I7C1_9NEOP